MLQETTDEFLRTQCAEPGTFAIGGPVTKGDPLIFQLADAPVAERYAEDIRRKILQRRYPAAHRLAVDDPVPGPDLHGYLFKPVCFFEGIAELRPVEDGKWFYRQEEALPALEPALPLLSQTATRNQVVHMGVVG